MLCDLSGDEFKVVVELWFLEEGDAGQTVDVPLQHIPMDLTIERVPELHRHLAKQH